MLDVMNTPRALALAVLAFAGSQARANPATLPLSCIEALNRSLPQWRLLDPPADAGKWARSKGFNPTVTRADLNADGRADFAALVSVKGAPRLIVCMAKERGVELLIVEQPYCSDLVYRSKAGTSYYNFDTGRREVLARDGVSVSCFEKAGATYVYEHGTLRRIIDKD
jgi:hypothetical protein